MCRVGQGERRSSNMKPPPPPCSAKKPPAPLIKIKSPVIILLVPILFWAPCLLWHLRDQPPNFSVRLADDDTEAPVAFNVTLHAVNRGQTDRCYRHGEAAVAYSGFTLAWGRTRAFCVDAGEATDVPVVLRGDGVRLPGSLGGRMAADRRQHAGAVELEIDLKLFRGDDGSAKPTWMSCEVTAGAAAAAAPPGLTACTVFSQENWASDIAPYWMH